MAKILDARGNPIESKTLAEPQTARLASLHQEFADHPARGITPQKLHAIMTHAEQGDLTAQSDLFEDMEERDTQIFADMSKRKRALLTIDWRVDPPPYASSAEKALADYAKERLDSIADLEDVILDALTAIGHGFSGLEITWGRIESERLPEKIEHRPQSWFTVDQATRSQIRLRGASMDGEPLNPIRLDSASAQVALRLYRALGSFSRAAVAVPVPQLCRPRHGRVSGNLWLAVATGQISVRIHPGRTPHVVECRG